MVVEFVHLRLFTVVRFALLHSKRHRFADVSHIENLIQAHLRSLRDELRVEIMKGASSVYFARSVQSRFAELTDFHFERMVRDFAARYPTVHSDDLGGIIGYALYFYYLR